MVKLIHTAVVTDLRLIAWKIQKRKVAENNFHTADI